MKNTNKYWIIPIILILILCSFSVSAFFYQSQQITISDDTTPPTTTYTIEGEKFGRNFIGEVTITFSATDHESGVKETWIGFHLGGGAMKWQRYTEPIIISNIGVKYIDYWSKDNVGNVEDKKTLSVTIIEDLGFLFVVGNFEESVTRYTGEYNFMFFIGFIDKEFNILQNLSGGIIIEKGTIIKEMITSTRFLCLKIARYPELPNPLY